MSTLNHQPLTVLVTGATSGLGKEIALRLARDDMQVIVVGRDATAAQPSSHRSRKPAVRLVFSRPTWTTQLISIASHRRWATSTSWSTTPAVRSGHRLKT